MNDAAAFYRLLGDEARLRILRLLAKERLNVTELTSVLGLAQSGVSRHLGLLKDAGVVTEDREGGFSYYAIARGMREGVMAPMWRVLADQFAATAASPEPAGDHARLQEVLRLRKENFTTHGASDRQLVPGRSWAAWARALGHLLPPLTVADLGCGEGYLAIEAARWARKVVAVDRSPQVLERAKALARRRRVSNVVWKRGELEDLPIADGAVDVALLSQALHHAEAPARALAEARRITAPGGRVLLLDLRTHDQDWVRDRFGDRWLGFDDQALGRMLADAGLDDVKVSVGARLVGDPFTVIVASGRRHESGADVERRPARASRMKRNEGK